MKFKKSIAMAMSVLMAAGMLAGCGSNGSTSSSTASGSASSASGEVSTDGVTISIFDKNSGSNTFDDPVAKAIEEKTGVKIQVENPTGDPLEKLNLMLTGQNYPDIVLMDRGNDIVNRYIEAGALLPLNDLIEGFQTDFDKTKLDTGVRKWTWFVKNGNGTDGTPYDVTQYKVKETRQVAMNHFGENDRWDTAEFAGLTPAGSTPDGLKWQKIQDIYDQEYPKIVNADSHDAAMEEYDKMISEMNDAGLEDVEKVITQNYQERMKLWNE